MRVRTALACLVILVAFAAPAAAQQRVLGTYENFTVVEVPPAEPGGDRYIYLVERTPASSSNLRFTPRGSATESFAFAGVWLLVGLGALAVYRRNRLATLVDQS